MLGADPALEHEAQELHGGALDAFLGPAASGSFADAQNAGSLGLCDRLIPFKPFMPLNPHPAAISLKSRLVLIEIVHEADLFGSRSGAMPAICAPHRWSRGTSNLQQTPSKPNTRSTVPLSS